MSEVQINDNTVEVTLFGKIYAGEAAEIRMKLYPLLGKGYRHYHFRMNQLVYMDSSGLGVLLTIRNKAVALGGEVRISGLKDDMLKLFELTLLTELFRMD